MADSGDSANKTVLSSDEGSLDSSSDSEAETDQSGATSNDDLSETFERKLAVSARRNETPPQKSYRSVPSTGKVKKQLSFAQYNDGKWLEDHPWKSDKPSCTEEQINTTVKKSKVYPVSNTWLTPNRKKVDLEKIYSRLPTFIDEMRGPSIRKELEDILNSTPLKVIGSTDTTLSPHVLEIKRKDVGPKDESSRRKADENNDLKAFSLPPQQDLHQPSEDSYWFLDCEYMLKMYLPDCSLQWFDCGDMQGKRIREINDGKKDERWMFIPSFRRAEIAVLEWPKDDIVTQESTIRILVVRPSEFKEYVMYCGHEIPVICLPQDEIGAGYPRYWIQKIALRLKLQFIWMIDDSVECFYEYHPDEEPPERKNEKGELVCNYRDYRRRKFGLVFERIEEIVRDADDDEKPIAAMSPRRWHPAYRPEMPFSCMPPQCAVYLNLRALSEKNVYYRPELKTFEDMIFGYECEQKGLKVYRDNRILLYDHKWKNTGACSPSVKWKKNSEEQ